MSTQPDIVPTPAPALEAMLSRVLTACVLIAAAVAVVGGGLYLFAHGGERPSYSTFAGQPAELTNPGSILRGVLALDPASIIQFSVLCLIATPVLRVAFSLVMFLVKRDGLYITVTFIVLAALGFGLFGGVH